MGIRYGVLAVYWAGAVLLLAALLVSFDYDFGRALFIASSMLPGMFCAQFFLPQALVAPHRRGVAVVGIVAGTVVVEWVSMLLASGYTEVACGRAVFPSLFSNPIFLLVVSVSFVLPCELLSRWLRQRLPLPRSITFVSERRKVTLEFAAIVYVESNDTEVALHMVDGTVYCTRTRISQWEQQLVDGRFVRIHRAYIVNVDHVTGVTSQAVEIGGLRLGFSRKYRERAMERLAMVR